MLFIKMNNNYKEQLGPQTIYTYGKLDLDRIKSAFTVEEMEGECAYVAFDGSNNELPEGAVLITREDFDAAFLRVQAELDEERKNVKNLPLDLEIAQAIISEQKIQLNEVNTATLELYELLAERGVI